MRVRMMDASGDMTFGQGSANFFVNSPAGVAQACQTRFALWVGEWFLDTTAGTPYATDILGTDTQQLYDAAIQARALGTPGMIGLENYSSSLDNATRLLTVSFNGITQYGTTDVIPLPLITAG